MSGSEKFLETNRAAFPSLWRNIGFSPSFTIEFARASTCSAGARTPFTPFRITSRGPFGQSKLMQGAPQVIASMSAKGKHSNRELRTKIPHTENKENGSSENGAKITRVAIPRVLA
jgi:hypothetical protein